MLAWLRVACTARGGTDELAALSAVAQRFPLLLLPEAVSDCIAAKVAVDLPGQQGGRATQSRNADQMAAAMQMLADNVGGSG